MMRLEDEKNLIALQYQELEDNIASFDNCVLLDLINSRYNKIGDVVAMELNNRKQYELLIDSILAKVIYTKQGKIRAVNILAFQGVSCPSAKTAYLFLLEDRSTAVVEVALKPLVFFQDTAYLPRLRELLTRAKKGTERYSIFNKAIEALEMKNPFHYFPSYHDKADVWKLDRKRFADKIGQ